MSAGTIVAIVVLFTAVLIAMVVVGLIIDDCEKESEDDKNGKL